MVALFLKRLDVEASMKANQLNREKRKMLVNLLKNFHSDLTIKVDYIIYVYTLNQGKRWNCMYIHSLKC